MGACKAMGKWNSAMVALMKEIGNEVTVTAKEILNGLIQRQNITVSGSVARCTGKACWFIKMVQFMMVNLRKITNMASAISSTPMAVAMRDNGRMTKNMAKALSPGVIR